MAIAPDNDKPICLAEGGTLHKADMQSFSIEALALKEVLEVLIGICRNENASEL